MNDQLLKGVNSPLDAVVVDSNIIIAQLSLVEVLGSAVIAGIFGIIMKWQDAKHEKQRQDDLEAAKELRKQDLEYREERERREAAYKEERARKDQEKAEYEAAKLDLLFATANGCDVLLQAAHGDQVNGNVDKARESISNAKSECNHIVNRQAVKSIGGNS